MKHPNKKIEAKLKWLSKNKVMSCFNNWVISKPKEDLMQMYVHSLMDAILEINKQKLASYNEIQTSHNR